MPNASKRGRNIRLLILFGVLALMLAALWYDRAVARPRVDAAYEAIAKLNDKINTAAGNRVMTSQDVQSELKRKPSRLRTEGPYEIEVYSWMAGLPFRSHDYYAVYTKDGQTRVFKTHYKIKLPLNELVPRPVTSRAQVGADAGPPLEEAVAGPMPGAGPQPGTEDRPEKEKRKRPKAAPPEEGKGDVTERPLGKEEPAKAPEASVPQPSKTDNAEAAPSEATPGTAAKEKQEQPAPPPEKKDEKKEGPE